jgi:excisionase family DNA binding protein
MKRLKKSETDAPPIGDRLLTLREAADVLRLSTRTMREYLQRNEIEGRIIGGRWRFTRAFPYLRPPLRSLAIAQK